MESVYLIKQIVNYQGDLYCDKTKREGTKVKLTDTSIINWMGWKYSIELNDGIKMLYGWHS